MGGSRLRWCGVVRGWNAGLECGDEELGEFQRFFPRYNLKVQVILFRYEYLRQNELR